MSTKQKNKKAVPYAGKKVSLLQKRHLVGTLIEYDVLVLLRNTFIAGYDPGVSQLGICLLYTSRRNGLHRQQQQKSKNKNPFHGIWV